jgi:hypothetical protein
VIVRALVVSPIERHVHGVPLRRVITSVLLLLTSACASSPESIFDDQRAADVYVEPDLDLPRAALALEIAAPPDAGVLTFHVAIDGRRVLFPRDARTREIAVHPGALFVDVTVTREVSFTDDSTLVPERQSVPCGRGRFCDRTVMVPRTRAFSQIEEQFVCKRGVELAVSEGRLHRVHLSSDGVRLCRIVCTVGDDDAHPEADCVVDGT